MAETPNLGKVLLAALEVQSFCEEKADKKNLGEARGLPQIWFLFPKDRKQGYFFFLTAFLATTFLATGFLTAAFLAGAAFLATGFLATAFLATGFLAAAFFAGAAFLAGAFFAAGFFLATGIRYPPFPSASAGKC